MWKVRVRIRIEYCLKYKMQPCVWLQARSSDTPRKDAHPLPQGTSLHIVWEYRGDGIEVSVHTVVIAKWMRTHLDATTPELYPGNPETCATKARGRKKPSKPIYPEGGT